MSGTKKFEITGFTGSEPPPRPGCGKSLMELVEDQKTEALLFTGSQFQKLVGSTELPAELVATVNGLTNLFYVAYLISSQLNLKIEVEQEILEIVPMHDLLHRVAKERPGGWKRWK